MKKIDTIKRWSAFALLLPLVSPLFAAVPPGVEAKLTLTPEQVYTVPGLAEKAIHARANPKPDGPYQFAVTERFSETDVFAKNKPGIWRALGDGRLVRRIEVVSPGALSLNFGFKKVFLPHGAELYIYNSDAKQVLGPYSDRDNKKHGELWTPIIPGERAVIEVVMPAAMLSFFSLELHQVGHGYRDFFLNSHEKSGSCNVDVVCSEGDAWRDEIRAVAVYTNGGGAACSGTLINNTAQDGTAYFLTADHCDVTEQSAPSVVIYWEYESPECRAVDQAPNGVPIPMEGVAVSQSGATFISGNPASDFTLIQLDDDPDEVTTPHWAGWDNRAGDYASAVVIHHPAADEKRISFEDNPTTTTDYLSDLPSATGAYIRVEDWDLGTTEGGSSGAALFNAERMIIGQLKGGYAACDAMNPGDNNLADWFGRISASWDSGATSDTRLLEWLDPAMTGVETLAGRDGCDRPTALLESSAVPAEPGELVTFTSSVSGGVGPYQYAWDVDGNGAPDGADATISARYSSYFNDSVSLTVTDSTGCTATATIAQSVAAPTFDFAATDDPVESCGDGDHSVEPGEHWTASFEVTNNSSTDAIDLAAIFTRSGGDEFVMPALKLTAGPDSFGYTLRDSQEPFCSYEFVDISGGEPLDFAPSGSYPAKDDGAAAVSLDPAGAFEFYGEMVSDLQLSSNGYVALGEADDGGDWSNDCPQPQVPTLGDVAAARLHPLHDDLVVEDAYYEYFADCPRPGDVAAGGCHVLMWSNADTYDGSGSGVDFEAILYSDTNQIVYQYRQLDRDPGASSTVGILEAGGGDGLAYSCDTADAISESHAVCHFHPGSPVGSAQAVGIELVEPANLIGTLNAGQSTTVDLEFTVDGDVPCGSLVAFDLAALVYDGGSAPGQSNILSVTIGDDGSGGTQCDSSAFCPPPTGPVPAPGDGLWNNPLRTGNGVDLFSVEGQMFAAWYTAREGRSATWYWLQNSYTGSQLHAPLMEVTWDHATMTPTFTTIGEATLSFVSGVEGYLTWSFNGQQGGEPIALFINPPGNPQPNSSGMWYNNGESGWGTTFNSRDLTDFALVYFFDDVGNPVWELGITENDAGGTIPMSYYTASCPYCAWVQEQGTAAGTIELQFDGVSGLIDTDLTLPGPVTGSWSRSDLPITILSEPL